MPWVVGCSYSGVSRKALRLRFRLTSVPRHGFKVSGSMLYVGMWFLSSFFRFGSAGGVRGVGVGCRVTLIIFPRRVNLITGVGLVMPQLVLGAVGYWLMTGSVGNEGESGSLVTLSLWSCAG